MNYKKFTLLSTFDMYKTYIFTTLIYLTSMTICYYACYDKGKLNTYDITSLREKYAVYHADDDELQSVYVCNVQERGKNEEYRHIIYVDANDYETMVKNKVSVLTRYENGKKGFSTQALCIYAILTVAFIYLMIPTKN